MTQLESAASVPSCDYTDLQWISALCVVCSGVAVQYLSQEIGRILFGQCWRRDPKELPKDFNSGGWHVEMEVDGYRKIGGLRCAMASKNVV
jgi:hypothetical protein